MIFLVSHNRYAEPYPVYPLGLAHVATLLAHEGIGYEVADRIVDTDDEILARIAAAGPQMIGISIRNLHSFQEECPYDSMDDLKHFVARVRGVTTAPIVLGGSAVNLFPVETTTWAAADFGVVEDPETFVELYERLQCGASVEGMANLVDGRAPRLPTVLRRPIAAQLPTLLLPERYTAYYDRHGGMLSLLTRRGCPFKCSFCTYPAIEGHQGRVKAIGGVIAEVERLVSAGIRYAFIVDSVFNADLKHSAAVARALIERKLPIKFCAYMTPRPFPPGYPELLAEAGIAHVEFGTDAFSDHMLKVYMKPFRFKDIKAASTAMRATGIFQSHFMILGAPGETEETLRETLERSREIPADAFIYCNGVTVYRGTALYARLVKEGRLRGDENPLAVNIVFADGLTPARIDAMVDAHGETHPPWVTRRREAATRPLLQRIRATGRRKGPLWELLNVDAPSFEPAPRAPGLTV